MNGASSPQERERQTGEHFFRISPHAGNYRQEIQKFKGLKALSRNKDFRGAVPQNI